MINSNYKKVKTECFVKFCKDNGIDQEVNISIFDAFDQIFDRAYSLGKQEMDAEGEEMLCVKASKVREMYALNENILYLDSTHKGAILLKKKLTDLFGSKCLPDELNEDNFAKSEPKPSEPKNEGTRQKQYVPKNAESGTHSFSHILKDDFRDHNRLHIAAMAMQGILSNADRMNKYEYVATEPPCADLAVVVARRALRYADALISECKKGGGNA